MLIGKLMDPERRDRRTCSFLHKPGPHADMKESRLSETSRQEISEILREFYLGGEGVELADRNPPTAHLSHINVDIPYRLESYMR